MTTVELDVVSDVMCPWCYIGKRRLEKALEQVEGTAVEVRWRPFQLDPTLPAEGKDRQQYLNEKFGGKEGAREIYQRVRQAGAAEHIPFAFDKIEKSPNTLDAHRLIRWSANGGEAAQAKMVERLFQLYFIEGANIGDHAVLSAAAAEIGMNEKNRRGTVANRCGSQGG